LHEDLNNEHYSNIHDEHGVEVSEEEIIMAKHQCSAGFSDAREDAAAVLAELNAAMDMEFDEMEGNDGAGFQNMEVTAEIEGASLLSTSVLLLTQPLPVASYPQYINDDHYMSQLKDPRVADSEHFEGTTLFINSNMSHDVKVCAFFYYYYYK